MHTRDASPTLHYISERFAPEPPGFADIRAVGEKLRPGMQVSAFEGRLLAWLVGISGAKRILEVGTFIGYSTRWMHTALPADGHITTLEFSPTHAAHAQKHFAGLPNITLVEGDALASIRAYRGAPFDFLFIDAEKKSYMAYLDAALPHLAPGAIVAADNSLLFGALTGEGGSHVSAESKTVMEAFNRRLANPHEFDGFLLPTPEGLTVGRRK